MSFRILGVLAVLVLVAPGAAALRVPGQALPDAHRSICVDSKIPPDVPPNVGIGVDCGPVEMEAGASGSDFEDLRAYAYLFFNCHLLDDRCPQYAIYVSIG